MENKELTHEESIQVIQGMIELAKNKINDSGFHFLLWGILVITASLSQYFMINMGMTQDSDKVWAIMPIIGIPAVLIYEFRKGKTERTKSKFDRMYGYLWLGFGITLIISIFISVSNNINPIAFILALVGLATFVSGAIYHNTPLIVGSIVFWIAAVICPFIAVKNQLLVNALAILIGYVIPGILLWKNAKSRKNV